MGSFYAVDIGAEYCEYILAGREGDYTLRGHTFTFTYCKLLYIVRITNKNIYRVAGL